jgi:hypothetical protein
MAPHPSDAELVHIDLPEGIGEASLEPLEGEGLPDYPDHEPVALEDSVDRHPAQPDAPTGEEGVDPQGSPRRVLPTEFEDTSHQVPVDPVRTTLRAAGLVTKSGDPFLPIVVAPALQGPARDPEEITDRGRTDPLLQVLLDRVETKTNIFLDHDPAPSSGAICPVSSGGQMS